MLYPLNFVLQMHVQLYYKYFLKDGILSIKFASVYPFKEKEQMYRLMYFSQLNISIIHIRLYEG